MIVNFKKCTHAILQEMVDAFYDSHYDVPNDDTLDYKWTPAEVNQILFRNFENPEKAIEELVSLQTQDLYGFTDKNESETSIEDTFIAK